MRKLRIKFKTLIRFTTLIAYAFLVAGVVSEIAKAYAWSETLSFTVFFIVAFAGIGIYHLLKRFVEIEIK